MNSYVKLWIGFLIFGLNITSINAQKKPIEKMKNLPSTTLSVPNGLEVATFGGGCFWCTEAIYEDVKGVQKVMSGYGGGHIANPTYKQVTSGTTGHAEVIQLFFDPKIITYQELLEIFWSTHDPTTLNRQGADVGAQYRSVIYYHSDQQKNEANFYKEQLNKEKVFSQPVVTEISAFQNFYVAENYHQNYFRDNGMQPYCQYVILPKVEKFKKAFAHQLK
jgi:peptide-methionine (S)-S-oxide reductase